MDDHKHRREALKFMIGLHTDLKCLGDYEDCSNLIVNLMTNPPDVVLMDIHMPGVDGIEGVKLLQKHFPKTFIIMQTVFDDDENLFNVLTAFLPTLLSITMMMAGGRTPRMSGQTIISQT